MIAVAVRKQRHNGHKYVHHHSRNKATIILICYLLLVCVIAVAVRKQRHNGHKYVHHHSRNKATIILICYLFLSNFSFCDLLFIMYSSLNKAVF